MYIFYEWLKRQHCKRGNANDPKPFGSAFLEKIMTHTKSYVKWLSENNYLDRLVPADVPRGKVIGKIPAYLTKQELGKMLQHLEQNIDDAHRSKDRHTIYAAYLWRAVTWMLYTSGLRNAELRSLTYHDIDIDQRCGIVLGKGDKLGAYTFSEATQSKLREYLRLRANYFPDTRFRYIFTLFEKGAATALTEQKLNLQLKVVAKQAGISKRVHAHLLRHTLATHLVMDGRRITDVRDKLRHANIATSSIYTHSSPQSLHEMTQSLG